ncbi:hypothetical protein C8J55DRAFT_535439 [Lentinula edodes]|uniref:Uncharacterized protein n=1 Tax=Lentinula lateritia TaxID=40482 RepID=A0A9W9AKY9_9AGAR|nr:hypothetical protein GG344DRAFT_88261 [Lentinula edodes]KAJ4484310.1 hypothetical protein C8J55DRAFT_535439 [Lentinula edodes]
MATKGATKLSQQLSSVAAQWPKDPFRPHLLLPTFLQSLSKHPKLTPEAVQAAQALKNGQAKKQFPLPKGISKPASYPMHYDRLVEGLHKSAQGIGRPWWKVFFGIW